MNRDEGGMHFQTSVESRKAWAEYAVKVYNYLVSTMQRMPRTYMSIKDTYSEATGKKEWIAVHQGVPEKPRISAPPKEIGLFHDIEEDVEMTPAVAQATASSSSSSVVTTQVRAEATAVNTGEKPKEKTIAPTR